MVEIYQRYITYSLKPESATEAALCIVFSQMSSKIAYAMKLI